MFSQSHTQIHTQSYVARHTLQGVGCYPPCSHSPEPPHVARREPLGSHLHVIFDPLALIQGAHAHASGLLDAPEVHEHVTGAIILGDEAEALLVVEPFDGSSLAASVRVCALRGIERSRANVLALEESSQLRDKTP